MKKFFTILIGIFALFTIINVHADDNIDIDVVLDKYLHSVYYQNILEDGNNTLSIVKDEDNHKLDVTFVSPARTVNLSYNYTDEYIESNNMDVTVTREDLKKNLVNYLVLGGLSNSILQAAGYNDYEISNDYGYDNYSLYGLLVIEENISFDADPANDLEAASGNYIRQYKMSLEKSKVDKLISDFGKTNGISVKNFKNAVATLTFDEITKISAKVIPVASEYDTSANEAPLCYVYRSDSENGVYQPITKTTVNGVNEYPKLLVKCDGTEYIIDDDLEPNTIYYYKVEVLASNKTNQVFSLQTKKEETENNNNEQGNNNNETNNQTENNNDNETNSNQIDNNTNNNTSNENTNNTENNNANVDNNKNNNPSTGISDYFIPLSLFIIVLVGVIYYLKKKNIINNL